MQSINLIINIMPKNNNTDYLKTIIYKIIPKIPKSIDDCYFGHCTTSLNQRYYKYKSAYKYYNNNINKVNYTYVFKLFDDYNGPENCVIIKIEDFPCNNKQDALNKEGEYISNNNCYNKHIPGNYNNKYNKPTFHCDICNETLYNSDKNKHEQTQKHLNNINIQKNVNINTNSKKTYYCDCGNEKYRYADNCNNCKNKNKIIQSVKEGRPSYSKLIELKETISIVKIGEIYNVSDNCIRKWIKLYEKYNLLD